MPINFTFRSVEGRRETTQLIDFLSKQSLGYPNYDEWVQRAEYEVLEGQKKAILAKSNGHIVGDIIWQQHKTLPGTRELKNLRVHPEFRNRYFASFLLRQAEVEELGTYDKLRVDAREDQEEMIRLMLKNGYFIEGTENLYEPGKREIILSKSKKS